MRRWRRDLTVAWTLTAAALDEARVKAGVSPEHFFVSRLGQRRRIAPMLRDQAAIRTPAAETVHMRRSMR